MSQLSSSGGRVLLIGGSGFVGSHVADEFLAQGWEVVVYGRSPEKFRRTPRVTYIRGSTSEHARLERAIAHDVDCVVHLASSTLPSTSNADPGGDIRTNLMDALALLDACVKYKIRKLVFASSGGTVYGIPKRLPITEDHPTNPICSYGIVKLAFEKYLQLYHRLHGLEYVVLRISNPYGPRQDPMHIQGVISVFSEKILNRKPITVMGTGSVVRDFIYVQDLAKLFLKAATSAVTGVFNASSGIGVSLNDLILHMMTQFDLEPKINRVPARACDVPAAVLDNDQAKTVFGWKPQVPLEQGLQEVRMWLMQQVIPQQVRLPALSLPPQPFFNHESRETRTSLQALAARAAGTA